jgi:hypothetical protein
MKCLLRDLTTEHAEHVESMFIHLLACLPVVSESVIALRAAGIIHSLMDRAHQEEADHGIRRRRRRRRQRVVDLDDVGGVHEEEGEDGDADRLMDVVSDFLVMVLACPAWHD